MEQLKFNVEEFHRGKWIPFIVTGKDGKEVQKRVFITQEQADWNNKQKDVFKLRYVLDGAKKEVKEKGNAKKELQEKYQEVTGKKPFHGWNEEQLTEKIAEATK